MIVEEEIVKLLAANGIKSSLTESVEWEEDFALIRRTSSDYDAFGGGSLTGWSGRESIEFDIDVYSMDRLDALKLFYEVRKLLAEELVKVEGVSNPELIGGSQLPTFNEQYGYTFTLTVIAKSI